VIPRLASRFRVVALDTRGHGRSTWGGTPLSYAAFADDAAALLRAVGGGPAIVLGLSDGGISGFHLAVRHPELIARLIAIGASADISGDTPHGGPAIRELTAAIFEAEQPTRLATWLAASPEPDRVRPFIDALMREVWRPPVYLTPSELARIGVPTAIVIGDRDEYVTLAHANVLHRTIPGSLLKVIPDCGHLIFESNPAAAWATIGPLLRQSPDPA
jgi:pimeloyl-ACP methyl ester carboxylesterase